jgi:pyridinium-3,5-bisthiocarboxylic acid mononucleotide nickel chelatase
MRLLYFDCFSGISGDMLLGAFIDAGLEPKDLIDLPEKLNLPQVKIIIKNVLKKGLNATKVNISFPEEQQHRHLADIDKIIDQADLADHVKSTAKKTFLNLAKAEARVHGTDVNNIHFHEVGALDAIIDITGAALAYHTLQIEKAFCSPVSVGGGLVKIAHGTFPVPAPATAYLLENFTIKQGPVPKELVTPTGAAVLATLCSHSQIPSYKITATGYGAGTLDLDEMPNVLRIQIGEAESKNTQTSDEVILLECNIDDLNPQIFPFLIDQVLEAGAVEAFVTPIVMKKGRPGHLFSALCHLQKVDAVTDIIFNETTTIGLRKQKLLRTILNRQQIIMESSLGVVQVKEITMPGGKIKRVPEFESCKKIALETGMPLINVCNVLRHELNTNLKRS